MGDMVNFDYKTRTNDYPKLYKAYASVECTVSGGVSDWDVGANTTLFDSIKTAHEISITTNSGISIKFNDISNDEITVTSDGFDVMDLLVTSIYASNTGDNATVQFFILGW